ncbi:hypothetical protein VNO77_19840 [Canavalia gladiata]|uniref:Protein XRI1 n=1 Tax=Canavalia gladiata TaxID=3824 RepID=A0AAN9LSB0_CANGL
MDYNNDKEPWDWHREDYCLQKSFNFDISQELWNEVSQNEDLSLVFNDETTPVKACGHFPHNANNSESNNMQKEPEECWKTSSQMKRRRMLQFNTQDGDHSFSNEQMSKAYLKLNGKDSNEAVLPKVSPQWVFGASGSASASNYEDLESAGEWLVDCFKDAEMLCPDDLNFSGADDVHIDAAELCNIPSACEQNMVQHHVTQTPRNVIFKGRKSFLQTPTKLVSSVAYPFAFIKPSGAQGDVTLKEINQRILSPPPLKSNQSREDPIPYPKSAFSGKPVVGKTKIRTEGGKGSITIMRTRG